MHEICETFCALFYVFFDTFHLPTTATPNRYYMLYHRKQWNSFWIILFFFHCLAFDLKDGGGGRKTLLHLKSIN